MSKSNKKSIPSLTEVRKILRQTAFDPRIPGPMRIIVDVDDPRYFRQRAVELIREAEYYPPSHYDKKLKQATQLITLARAYGCFQSEEK